MRSCNICEGTLIKFGTNKILSKYDVAYYRCSKCGFVTTETPYWLGEAYCKAIADEDTGYVGRNLLFARFTQQLIHSHYNHRGSFLDYGAGYGLFVRLMRDAKVNFFSYDEYCMNLFAKEFQVDLTKDFANFRYELITSFEVFEHFIFPMKEIKKLFLYTSDVLFSTELISANPPKFEGWPYYSGITGQHISFYSLDSLRYIAEKFNKRCYSDGRWLHLLTDREDLNIPLKRIR